MPRNGSGTFTLVSGNPVVTNTTISSTWANNTLSDIATALTQSLTKDGQTVPSANLPMGSFKLTGLAAGTTAGDSVRFEQLFSQGNPTDVASASTTDIGAITSNFINITGTTTITSLGANYNGPKMIKFTGALTLTYNATTLVTPTGKSILTKAGDTCIAIPKSTSSGTSDGWNIVAYQSYAVNPIAGAGTDIASASTVDLTAAVGNVIVITGTTAVTAFTMNAGQVMCLVAESALPLTYNATTMNIEGSASYTCSAGDRIFVFKDIDNVIRVNISRQDGNSVVVPTPREYISGLTMSTAGSSATMTIAAGQAADSTNVVSINLSSSVAKTTSSWAVGTGNGGLDTGAIANSTWYHFYVIRRPDTNVVDVICSLSASSPTLPTNYTQYRRIGSGLTNGSAQWVKFVQNGDDFLWDVYVSDVSATNPGTSAVSRTLTVPTGVIVKARITAQLAIATQGSSLLVSDLSVSDQAPSLTTTPLYTVIANVTNSSFTATLDINTNTSSQIRTRLSLSDASTILRIVTIGWKDSRGKS